MKFRLARLVYWYGTGEIWSWTRYVYRSWIGVFRIVRKDTPYRMAGQMMLAGLRSESPHRLKERVFLRLYGNDFTPVERSRIVEGIRDHDRRA